MHWPSLSAEDQTKELDDLRAWVDQLAVRFPLLVKLPACWSQHNDLVEVLASLRDAERGCYAEGAPLTAPAEWHRIVREMEARLDHWIKRLQCGVAARGHVASRRAGPAADSVSPTRTAKGEAATPGAGQKSGGLMR
jgi:hypothetical protein